MAHSRQLVRAGALTGSVLMLVLGGCIALGGSDKHYTKNHPPTLGKQFQDLKAARDSGALTDEEYARAKERLLTSDRR